MKKYIGSTIVLVAEIASFVLAVLWYRRTREEEPLILIIGSVVALITTLFFKAKAAGEEEENGVGISIKGNNSTTVANNKNSTIQIQQVGRTDEEN